MGWQELMDDVQKLIDNQTWEEPVNIEKYRHWSSFKGMQVPVFLLEYEHQSYRWIGRFEKAEKSQEMAKKIVLNEE